LGWHFRVTVEPMTTFACYRLSGKRAGLRPNTRDYAHSTASCVIAITAVAD
jgi:hypothetical protein